MTETCFSLKFPLRFSGIKKWTKTLKSPWISFQLNGSIPSKKTASNSTLPSRATMKKRASLIRRIDFAWAVEDDEEKEKLKKKSSKDASATWQWQSMMENLQLAHQELSVIIDLINTVEANDTVTVAGMTRPKPLPNELLSDLAVSAATKLQCYRHLGKYFNQSAKVLEQQLAREARFYGARISKIGKLNKNEGQVQVQLLAMKASLLIFLIIHYTVQQQYLDHLLFLVFALNTIQLECWLPTYLQIHAILFILVFWVCILLTTQNS